MRDKRKKFIPAGEVIALQAGRLKLRDRLLLYRVWEMWEGMIGSAVARHALPFAWKKGTLVIRVDHATWMAELEFLKGRILTAVKEALPGVLVRGVRFEQGELLAPGTLRPKEDALPPKRPLTVDESDFVECALAPIKDEAVRSAARRAIRAAFARRAAV